MVLHPARCFSVIADSSIDSLDPQQLRQAVRELQEVVQRQAREAAHKQAIIEKLTHENAVLKRLKFAAQSERFNSEQRSLLEEALDADLQAVAEEIERLAPQDKSATEPSRPKRGPLPAQLPRREIRHEPQSTTCSCGCE